jgi:folate-binding protein YgfZ
MNSIICYQLDSVTVVDIVGADTAKIIHNLTTNEVTRLGSGRGCESFITDVRGKTLGHVLVFATEDGLRLIGAGGQSTRLGEHIDRYTIREDARPHVRDDEYVAVVLTREAASAMNLEASDNDSLVSWDVSLGDASATAYQTPWLGRGSAVILAAGERSASLADGIAAGRLTHEDEISFHANRTLFGFPWYGTDLDETNLPQEADRNEQAISFTKGCYLGQETVARLDALGQVQKKLVRWSIRGAVPAVGTVLTADDKTVGRLTSVTAGGDDDAIAIGMARRSHFEAGAIAEGIDPDTQQKWVARVM